MLLHDQRDDQKRRGQERAHRSPQPGQSHPAGKERTERRARVARYDTSAPFEYGNRYKPATLRGYRQALEDHVLPLLGGRKMNAVTTADLQALVDRWSAEVQSPSTIRNSIKPLQAIYRRARAREGLAVNPTRDLELPGIRCP